MPNSELAAEEAADLSSLEFEDEFEPEVIKIDTKQRKIFTKASDPEVSSLYDKYKKGRLIVRPDFQRYYVWDSKKASRLIESALLGIPLPVIYLAEEEDGRTNVIDGQQRLTSFFAFIDGRLPEKNKPFKLEGLQVFSELNGKLYSELDEINQEKIKDCEIRAITFQKESDPNLRFEIFERLNTGAVSLNDQELRNCVFRGPYNQLLRDLSEDKDFMYLLGLKKYDPRMKDVELVLRFASFYHATYLKYKPPIKNFLNADMQNYQNIEKSSVDELSRAFKNSIKIIRSLFDNNAFKRFHAGDEKNPNGYWEEKRFNASLYDVMMYAFSDLDTNTVYQHLDAIREGFINLMTSDQDFIDSILLGTSQQNRVVNRFDKVRLMLQDIVGIGEKEPRGFSYELKKHLFDENPTCAICGNQISHPDDAAVDHIEQYWTGGKTIPENARLAHRYCNWSRPRKD